MAHSSPLQRQLIQQLGETDQQFLQQNSPELALQRGQIRLKLIQISKQKAEQLYFLQQTLVILEQARLEFDEMPLSLYLDLSILLAQAYLVYFELSQQTRYALIAQQILKPLAHHQSIEIYQVLIQAAHAQQHNAMAQHWRKKRDALIQRVEPNVQLKS